MLKMKTVICVKPFLDIVCVFFTSFQQSKNDCKIEVGRLEGPKSMDQEQFIINHKTSIISITNPVKTDVNINRAT